MSDNRSRDFSKYDAMSTEALEELLRLDYESPDGEETDIDLLLHITQVLALRDQTPEECKKTAQQAYKSFEENYLPTHCMKTKPTAPKRCWLSMAAAAAVLCLVVLSIIPKKVDADRNWLWFTRVTSEILEFFGVNDNDDRILEYTFTTDNDGLQQVYDTLTELGIEEPVVPQWLPDESFLHELRTSRFSRSDIVYTSFFFNNEEIVLRYEIFEEEYAHSYQKNETDVEVYEISGVTHYVSKNLSRWSVVWNRDQVECFLTIDCEEETLYKILESIYTMEDN